MSTLFRDFINYYGKFIDILLDNQTIYILYTSGVKNASVLCGESVVQQLGGGGGGGGGGGRKGGGGGGGVK